MSHYNKSHCWACSGPDGKQKGSIELYEAMLEWLESSDSPEMFSISLLFHEFKYRGRARAPTYLGTVYSIAQTLVRDLAVHGLAKCVRKKSNGYCTGWALLS